MKPLWIAGAVVLALYLVARRRAHGRVALALGALVVVGALLIGTGVVALPNVEKLIEDAGQALGKWTYLAVGILAFLETGAFIGLVAPGETTVIVGGLVAGQGQISLTVLIAIVWTCAVAGDVTSYVLGRRLGREFMVRHGARVKITEERLEQVEEFFARRGGMTILIGRFIGLIRAIAPFVAGASRMPLRKFLPYDILGAGLWAVTFCTLGYVFWRSFDTLTQWVSRGLFAFGLLVAMVVGVVFAVRLQRDPALRARTRAWIEARLEQPLLRPFAPALRAGWSRIARPAAAFLAGPARFLWNRLTPGELGLEVTTLLAIAAVGAFGFFALGDLLDERDLLPFDRAAADLAADLQAAWLRDAAEVFTELASLPVVAGLVGLTTLWALVRKRHVEALVLPAGLLLTVAAVELSKAYYDRPRPDGTGSAFPSAHAAYAMLWIACAVVLVRAGSALALRLAAVTVACALAAALALSRVYLGVSHLSDVEAGAGLAAAILAALGVVAIVVAQLRHNDRPEP